MPMDHDGPTANSRRTRRQSWAYIRALADSVRPFLGTPKTSPKCKLDDDDGERYLSRITSEEHLGDNGNIFRRNRSRRSSPSRLSRSPAPLRRMSSVESDRVALAAVTKTLAINALLVLSWYANSVGISVFNKWVISKDNLDFHFPLFFTSFHMIVQFLLASLMLYVLPQFRPDYNNEAQYTQLAQTTQDDTEDAPPKQKPGLTKVFFLTRIAPCAAATGLDIGLGNMSLKFISLTFYTMCKSSVLGFVLLFALLFRLESPSLKIAAVIAAMTLGVIMMVAGETAFDQTGFALIMSAAFFSGFRWSLTQMMLLHNAATSNPFSSIFFLAPVMFFVLVILAFPVEGIAQFSSGLQRLHEAKGSLVAACVLLFPGILAFAMTASEFALLKRTSVVTLSVCGIFKEVVMIVTAATIFGDELTKINISGLVITIASIAAYNYMKFTKMRDDARRDAHEMADKAHARNLESLATSPDPSRSNSTAGLIQQSLGAGSSQNRHLDPDRSGSISAAPPKRPEDHE